MDESTCIQKAISVVTDTFAGILTTIDPEGNPHPRVVSSKLPVEGIRFIYSLSHPQSRKLDHIRANPRVSWLYSTVNFKEVITLTGRAKIIDDPLFANRVWGQMKPSAGLEAFYRVYQENPTFVVIETEVETIEYLTPHDLNARPFIMRLSKPKGPESGRKRKKP